MRIAAHAITRHAAFYDAALGEGEALAPDQSAAKDVLNDRIASGALGMVENRCLCGQHGGELVATVDRYGIRQETLLCPACGLLRSDPRMDDAALAWFYGSDSYRRLYGGANIMPPTREKFDRMTGTGRKRRDIIMGHLDGQPVRRVAEIGCGAGWNLFPFHETGIAVAGCDFSPGLTAFGRSLGMDIREGETATLAGDSFDLILLSHVLEHMPDPQRELEQLLPLLLPDGALYIEVPDARAFCFDTLQSAHLWYFTPDHLAHLLAGLGLRSIATTQIGPHFSMLFRRAPAVTAPDVGGLPLAMRQIIQSYDRRQRFKAGLRRLGLLGLIQRLRRLYRP